MTGVQTCALPIYPNAKIADDRYKLAVNNKIAQDKVFEVLLVDRNGFITEGSRSNVFFVKGNSVFTAPGQYVLMGITRQYVIHACREAGFNVIEALTGRNLLYSMEALFISGTSIKVLPVARVEGYVFGSSFHPGIIAIRDRYDMIMAEYINKYSNQ